ncbi:MAG: bifunctional proline dehydrogenase/L-glutamate gamma-semialdehyde dehydrogenase [Candidatus Omnitrophica bacterium]|nr:bifunctional proline dehydrogenase/L-glutamate gamma-semialdehyde dehydrogenase [Candidatus Omnitrophota bacterium]
MISDTGERGKRLEPHALEQRTQAIGRELFAAARREHAHLSSVNRWTAHVLSWCLGDPKVKGSVLRFIDVLPSLKTPRDIAQHVLDYFPTTDLQLPGALRLGTRLARPRLLTQGALAAMVRHMTEQVARQFIAESAPEASVQAIRALASRGATCSLDVLGEQVLSEPEANRYAAQCASLLAECASAYAAIAEDALSSCGPRVNLSIKPSALSPRFDPISPPQSVERAASRLLPLIEQAASHSALVNLDMEQYELRDLTLALAQRALLHEGARNTHLGVVIQAYLQDAEPSTEELLEWLRRHERTLTVRLVKGAYWDAEVAAAAQCHWSAPVWPQKAQTDAAYEALTRRLLEAYPLVTTAIASHNLRSIAHAMAVAETLGLAKDQLEFQLLYGMGEAIHAAIRSRGYPVRVYTPIGELIPGMAYLVRRILENTANESFLRQEFLDERRTEELLSPPAPDAAGPATAAQQTTGLSYTQPLINFALRDTGPRLQQAQQTAAATLGRHYPLLIGGQAVETVASLTARNPAHPQQIIGIVSQAGRAEVDRAVACAAQAQPAWARTPAPERITCLRRAAALMRRQRDELMALAVLEVGKTWREADIEIVEAIEYLEYYGLQMEALSAGKAVDRVPGEHNVYRYRPRGVAVVIAPWNFPAAILTGMTSAALATGNAAIVKPAEESSVIAARIVALLCEAGVPEGVVQFLPGVGEKVGSALVEHPQTHAVLFTGSKAVGLSIVQACAKVPVGQRFVKHVVTEMGGKNAIIIDADADLDAAVSGILRSAFSYAGQKCSAASRLIVHEAAYERLLPRLIAATDRLVIGDPADPSTDMGPLIDETAQQRLRQAGERAHRVASVAYEYPGSRMPSEGYFAAPMLVAEVDPADPLATQELFGPLACLFRVKTFEEALRLANATDYALTGGVYSRSPSHIARAIDSFDVGNLYLNRPITGAMVGRQPFGGHRLSGLGTKAGGPDYLLQLMIPQTIAVNTTRHSIPLE